MPRTLGFVLVTALFVRLSFSPLASRRSSTLASIFSASKFLTQMGLVRPLM